MVKFYMLIQTAIGHEFDVARYIRKLKLDKVNIHSADTVYGVHDVVVIMEAPRTDDLKEALPAIRNYEFVHSTITEIVIEDSEETKTSSPTSP